MTKIYKYMFELCIRLNQESQWGELLKAIFKPLEALEKTGGQTAPAIDTIQKIYEIKTMHEHPFMLELR